MLSIGPWTAGYIVLVITLELIIILAQALHGW